VSLYCSACDAPHDVDLAPDTGECVICGGPLIEDEAERGEVGPSAVARRLVTTVNDGLAAAALNRGKAPKGQN
jgi:hypothetical protein